MTRSGKNKLEEKENLFNLVIPHGDHLCWCWFGLFAGGGLNHTWFIFAEGPAAGAMLTMIATSMIPEAVHMGNDIEVGLSQR